jgi:hypothetical protein
MEKKKKGPDVIDKILDACYQYNKDALFTMSLMHQYEERGFLTKGQLEGLFNKASTIKDMPVAWLATLEATIAKLPTRDKTPIQKKVDLVKPKDAVVEQKIQSILTNYPQHKAVLALQFKFEKQNELTATELKEVEKFYDLLIVKKMLK